MIFICYSHVDANWCQDLLTMAAPLTKYGGMQIVSDADIAAGAAWRSTIQKWMDKATVAVLPVSRHSLASNFIMEIELPYLLMARKNRGLEILWFLVSHCLYEKSPLQPIQAALPTSKPLEDMTEANRSAALKILCQHIERAWMASETPKLDASLGGRKVQKKMEALQLLRRPASRRTEIFIRADNSGDWYHQGAVLPGNVSHTCHFGADTTTPGTGFHIIAITTELAVPHQGGKPTIPFPICRTRSEEVRVIRV
jgi:hypothetical protein